MFGKIKQQARSWGLHVLLMDMGQTASYPLYSAVSVQRWNVPNFQNEILFSTSSSSFLIVTRVLPHSTQSSQQWAHGPGGSPLPLTPQAAVSPCPCRGVPTSIGQCPHAPPVVSPCPSCGAGGAVGPLCSASGQRSWQPARDCCGLWAVCGLKTELKWQQPID